MRTISLFFIMLMSFNSIFSSQWDYFRDGFLAESTWGQYLIDFYYENSSLSSYPDNIPKKDLRVLVILPTNTPTKLIKNILLHSNYVQSVIFSNPEAVKSTSFKLEYDLILIDEQFKDEMQLLNSENTSTIAYMTSSFKPSIESKFDTSLNHEYIFDVYLNNIRYLLKNIWRVKDTRRNFSLYTDSMRDLYPSSLNKLSFLIFIICLLTSLLYGVGLNLFKKKKKKACAFVIYIYFITFLLLGIFLTPKIIRYHSFKEKVKLGWKGNSKERDKLIPMLDSEDPLELVISLRALTERLIISKKNDLYWNTHKSKIIEKSITHFKHNDYRVRMWALTLIGYTKNAFYIEQILDYNLLYDKSINVRSRAVRALNKGDTKRCRKALLAMLKIEKEFYVLHDISKNRYFRTLGKQ